MSEGKIHPDFFPFLPKPPPGLCQDNNFGHKLGASADCGCSAPDRAAPHEDLDQDDEYKLPDDPISNFICETTPQMIPPTKVAVTLQALLHLGKSTAQFAKCLFAVSGCDYFTFM